MATYSGGLAERSWNDWENYLDADRSWRAKNPTYGSYTSVKNPSESIGWSADDPDNANSVLENTISAIPGGTTGGSSGGLWSWLTDSNKKDPRAMTTSWDTNLGKIGNTLGLAGAAYSLYDNLFGDSAAARKEMLKGAKLENQAMQTAMADRAAWKSALNANATQAPRAV